MARARCPRRIPPALSHIHSNVGNTPLFRDRPEPRHSDRVLLVRAQVCGACGAGICVFDEMEGARRMPCSDARRAMQKSQEDIMRTILLATCTAVVTVAGAFGASAAPLTPSPMGESGAVIRVDDRYYYDGNNGDYEYRYQNYDNGSPYQNNYYDNGYGNGQMVSPRWIVRRLADADYHNISQPM